MGPGESSHLHERAAEKIQLPKKEGRRNAQGAASAGPTAVRSATARHKAAGETATTARTTATDDHQQQ